MTNVQMIEAAALFLKDSILLNSYCGAVPVLSSGVAMGGGRGGGGREGSGHFFWRGGTFDLGGTLGFKYLIRFESQFGVLAQF